MLPYDFFGWQFGLFSRIQIALIVVIGIIMAVLINLKVHAGIEITRTTIEISCGAGFLLAIAVAIVWHKNTASEED